VNQLGKRLAIAMIEKPTMIGAVWDCGVVNLYIGHLAPIASELLRVAMTHRLRGSHPMVVAGLAEEPSLVVEAIHALTHA
jgi:hypothetical protein